MPTFVGSQTALSASVVDSQINNYATSLANGTVEIWTTGGTPQSPTGTKILTFNLGATPYAASSGGVAQLTNQLTATSNTTGSPVPAIWRVLNSAGTYRNGGTFTGASGVAQGEVVTLASFPVTTQA